MNIDIAGNITDDHCAIFDEFKKYNLKPWSYKILPRNSLK